MGPEEQPKPRDMAMLSHFSKLPWLNDLSGDLFTPTRSTVTPDSQTLRPHLLFRGNFLKTGRWPRVATTSRHFAPSPEASRLLMSLRQRKGVFASTSFIFPEVL